MGDNSLLTATTTTKKTIVSIHDFFYDDPELDYKPLPHHEIHQSPCNLIIGQTDYKTTTSIYFCKLHPDVKSIYLSSIEHHIKYKDPDIHKAEILRLMLLLID